MAIVFYFGSVKETTELEHFNSGKKVSIRFYSILATESIFSTRFDSPIWYICRLYTDIQIVMMVSLVKGLAASLFAVVHSVPYQYQLDNFQQVKNVSKVLNAANSNSIILFFGWDYTINTQVKLHDN